MGLNTYLNFGWKVIPFDPTNKRPLFSVNQAVFLSKEQLKQNFDKYKQEVNLGLITGNASGVFVVDIEDKESLDKFKKRLISLGVNISFIPSVKTPRGTHYYFKQSLLYNSSDFSDFEVYDNGSCVLLPPSKSKEGFVYTWVKPFIDF